MRAFHRENQSHNLALDRAHFLMDSHSTLFGGRLSGLEENSESVWFNLRSLFKSHGTVSTPKIEGSPDWCA